MTVPTSRRTHLDGLRGAVVTVIVLGPLLVGSRFLFQLVRPELAALIGNGFGMFILEPILFGLLTLVFVGVSHALGGFVAGYYGGSPPNDPLFDSLVVVLVTFLVVWIPVMIFVHPLTIGVITLAIVIGLGFGVFGARQGVSRRK